MAALRPGYGHPTDPSPVADLQRLLREAQGRECPARDPNGECIAVNEAISEKEQAQEELLVAMRNAESWQETAQQERDITAAVVRAKERAEALVGRFALRCREIAVKDCGYWQAEYDDHEGVALLEEADRILTPAQAQAQRDSDV